MTEFLMLTKSLISAAICVRLFCFDWPRDSRYKIGVTSVAYYLMLCSGAVAILLAMGNQAAAQIFDAGIYICVLVIMFAARGNLARVMNVRNEKSSGVWK